ncbi:hypothetical protein MESS4_520071 [Mesorhizobium sp. STM 4661]|nr:hypothetical protein MESS4_520071 [Mesorhizobium sp. STM 4661]
MPEVPSRWNFGLASTWLSRSRPSKACRRTATSSTMAAKISRVTVRPPKRSASETTPTGSDVHETIWLASLGERWPVRSISAISEEPPPMSNRTTPCVSRSTSEPQPDTASRASVWRSMISSFSPASRSTRSRNSTPFAAVRQASVAISLAFLILRPRNLSPQIFSASTARSIAGCPSRPLAVRPSPSLTMREKASMTRNWPWRVGTATSSRQLLVPRSSAANTGSSCSGGRRSSGLAGEAEGKGAASAGWLAGALAAGADGILAIEGLPSRAKTLRPRRRLRRFLALPFCCSP